MQLDFAPHVGVILVIISVITLILGIITFNVYLIAITATVTFSTFVFYKLWDLIEAKIFEKTNFIQLFNGFQLGGNRSVAIARHGNAHTATACARVDALGTTDVDRVKIENLIARVNQPFKLVLHVEKVDLSHLLNRMETKKNMKEIELSRVNSVSKGKGLILANRLRSEITYLEHEMDGIRGGGIPLKLAYYIMTSATGENRYSIEEGVKLQLRELTAEFDATFGTKSSLVSGEELINMMRFDSVVH